MSCEAQHCNCQGSVSDYCSAHMYTHTQIHLHTRTHSLSQHTHALLHTHTHQSKNTHIHTHTHTHTHMHAYVWSREHTRTHKFPCLRLFDCVCLSMSVSMSVYVCAGHTRVEHISRTSFVALSCIHLALCIWRPLGGYVTLHKKKAGVVASLWLVRI